MKSRFPTASVLLFLAFAGVRPLQAAREKWEGVSTPNFFVAGNVSSHELRQAALKMEQFREVLARLFGKSDLRTSAPVRVIVFRDRASYEAVRPVSGGKPSSETGFFQPSNDVHYAALLLDGSEAGSWPAVLHPYVHALLQDNARVVPLWFAEGLAEYFSTFEILPGEKRVRVGGAMRRHVAALKAGPLLPLEELFEVGRDSPGYDEAARQGIYYAESWALVHYLVLGKNQRRQPKVAHFIKKLVAGEPAADSFRGVFETSYREMDAELEKYVRNADFAIQDVAFDERLAADREFRSSALSEAQTQFYSGDLLMHQKRTAEAEPILALAIQLDPGLAEAHAAMAMMRASQGKTAEARAEIEKVPASSDNFLLSYYRALVHSGKAAPGDAPPSRNAAPSVRAELEKVIARNPGFTEAYSLLATYNADTDVPLQDCIELLEEAIRIAPGRQELLLALAGLQLRSGAWAAARDVAERVLGAASTPAIAAESKALLERIMDSGERQTGVPLERSTGKADLGERLARQAIGGGGATAEAPDPAPEGERISGLLTEIVCRDQQMSLIVRDGARRLVFRSDSPRKIAFTSYTPEVVARITCGPRDPPVPVVVRFRKSTAPDFDGEPLSVDFVAPGN